MADKVMIHVDQLRKDYGSGRYAVDGISFDVRAGEVLGFLGPNGAGKTTTMKILTSFLAPTVGPRRGRRPRRLRAAASRCAAASAICPRTRRSIAT